MLRGGFMLSEAKELLELVKNMPDFAVTMCVILVAYKLIIYLSTTGAIVLLGKLLISKFPFVIREQSKATNSEPLYYHGLLKSVVDCKKAPEWFYNRNSLEELSKQGIIVEWYCGKERVSGYMG